MYVCMSVYTCVYVMFIYRIHAYGSTVKNLKKVLEPRRGALVQFTDI